MHEEGEVVGRRMKDGQGGVLIYTIGRRYFIFFILHLLLLLWVFDWESGMID